MRKFEIQIKDTKGKIVGYKTIKAISAMSIVKNPSKHVGRDRRISNIWEIEEKDRKGGLGLF